MIIATTRFGQVTINEEDVITFSDGLIGFPKARSFVLLDDPNDELFIWLQSCEEPHLAFPVLEPELFSEEYNVGLTTSDLSSLGLKENETGRNFTIVTIPADVSQMTANMKAPLVVNVKKRMGKQCVLQNNKLAIKEPIFTKLQQRMLTHTEQTPIKRSYNNESGVEEFMVILPSDQMNVGKDLG